MREAGGRQVTMRDIARALGVSPMTVSRALRNNAAISADTRRRVLSEAERQGYIYDSTAQAFRQRRTGFVAAIIPSLNNANFAETYRGLSEGLRETDLQLLLGSTGYQLEEEERLITELLERKPEAMLLTGGTHSEAARRLLEATAIPIIETWDLPADPLDHCIGFSNEEAMTLLVEHLAEEGRKRLGFLGAAPGADFRGVARRAGCHAAARALGLPEVRDIYAGPAPIAMEAGAGAVRALGADLGSLDALVCVSDPVAFGALSACQRLGVDVPGDLAVTGFGAFEISRVSNPTITTIDVSAYEIGATAGRAVRAILKGGEMPPLRRAILPVLRRGGTS